MAEKITKREDDYSKWYNDIIKIAELAEHSDVRGCMVIKPYGFAIWEKIKDQLDKMFKETGHQNAYFPLFVPKSLFEAEEKNAEGFAKECAVVTHYRLKTDPNEKGKLMVDPDARLEEELVVRPTSEAIIWNTYKKWIQSYRDLPILINQWANVVRWEMRTRLFLRTAEFLWQEGHTAHATKAEAIEETEKMVQVYADFAEQFMAMPVIQGLKSESERFAGAEETYCIEAMMQDGKALQAGTSHFLGQNFAKAFEVKFSDKEGKLDYVWATSWGVSTRLMGALIMTHSDDLGLVLPPALAPIHVAIVPIFKGDEQLEMIKNKLNPYIEEMRNAGLSVQFDDDDNRRPGWKFAEYEAKGVPVRLAIGPRDLENGQIEVARRDTQEKFTVALDEVVKTVNNLMKEIQDNLYERALKFRESNIEKVDSYEDFKSKIENGGFFLAHWDGSAETEEKIKQDTKATIRCIPLEGEKEEGKCMVTGKPSAQRVIFAKAY
ncbi:proline--tRNA ligase [Paracrocinitomix mangrovi]|uniref:proline--tRNA ligase n=1 Tax=Paracrocinitomix mangrovi TaxID=2862509 RepID=UPI001C8DEC02|nr:proline--tRNA ligase [Paracrocinitomix mangrovi]UKN02842.1 proline--tRNA ligase [Paracrocinitomix mangrovi]